MIFRRLFGRIPPRSRTDLRLLRYLLPAFLALATLIVSPAWAAEKRSGSGNYDKALRWYYDAAKSGDAEAQFRLGLVLEDGSLTKQDLKAAISWYGRAAEAGHALGQYKFGLALQFGNGIALDLRTAREWYEAAGKQGIARASFNLALMQRTGEGGEKDLSAAASSFEAAARNGISEAFVELGYLHARDATGDAVDQIEALKWFILAERSGIAWADRLIQILRARFNLTQQSEAEARAAAWK